MQDEATAVALPLHRRVRHGMRHPANWLQLVRFGLVGASGYVVNLAVFAGAVHVVGIDYKIAAVLAFLVSVTSNFWLNRRWTFDARGGHAGFQAARFLTVSVVAFLFSYLVLLALVEAAGLPEVLAQAVAIVTATPLSFLGQKLWSFRA
ncbi:MAG TPA: GtrA family protein [Conexibacter sp.]|nr:GtrA family protein [Conexibacter sp.]